MDSISENKSQLRNIMCSLYYLSKEAEILGMQRISNVIKSSISKIKTVMDQQEARFDDLIINDEAIATMRFLYAYSCADTDTKKEFIEAIEHIENTAATFSDSDTSKRDTA